MGLMHKLKNWVTGDDLEDDIYSIDDEFDPLGPDLNSLDDNEKQLDKLYTQKPQPPKKHLKVVDHHAGSSSQVMVIEPKAFEEALEIVEHLRAKRATILNLHMLDMAQSQRVVDFLSGATHAIDGQQQRIGDGVFIFTPMNFEVASYAARMEQLSAHADDSWNPNHMLKY
ncbi:MAG: cell division protein SepF [Cyanobacteria bacterium HKST-UBA05]|nr:cell division protein SepF [Cyanobacteria bacterium HKST-UBA05]